MSYRRQKSCHRTRKRERCPIDEREERVCDGRERYVSSRRGRERWRDGERERDVSSRRERGMCPVGEREREEWREREREMCPVGEREREMWRVGEREGRVQ